MTSPATTLHKQTRSLIGTLLVALLVAPAPEATASTEGLFGPQLTPATPYALSMERALPYDTAVYPIALGARTGRRGGGRVARTIPGVGGPSGSATALASPPRR